MHPDLFIVLVNQRVEEDRREAAAERLLIRGSNLRTRRLPHRRGAGRSLGSWREEPCVVVPHLPGRPHVAEPPAR